MNTEAPVAIEGQVGCSTSSVLLRRVRATLGAGAAEEVLRRAGVPQDAAWFDDVANWMPYEHSLALFRAGVEVSGDEDLAQRVGEDTVRQHAGTPVATMLRSLGSPQAVYEQLSIAASKFTTVTELHPEHVVAGSAVVRAQARPGYHRDRNMCLLMLGMLTQPTVLFGMAPATVDHPECEARGDRHCRYVISWDADEAAAATDPEKLVVALEARLAAMHDRLDSMYATAGDLIALDDLDASLARIIERAATAVRAPSYLVAVRTPGDHEPRVHARGIADSEVDAEAKALLDGTADERDGSRLVAEIASATRHYGWIMADSRAGAFFPYERDLLRVYASYAASVLDTHAALAAARASERQSRALVQLARSLAAAPSRTEAAQRLVEATPSVVDCDRVSVFLWDEDKQALTYCAATSLPDDAHEKVLGLELRPADTPVLERLVTTPDAEPLFFGPDADEPFVLGLMQMTGAVAVGVAPIVSGERFYGVLSVSVTDEPRRLAPSIALREGLVGVVAQAATTLENARLLETMAHQASHDNLTGLLGHRAFHEELGADRAGVVTLAVIDIDDFKAINDEHGHPVGDEALRHVSAALAGAVREGDAVFRIGGEEFAVLMHGLAAGQAAPVAERLRRAVAASAFHLPLRVSIGLASHDGEDAPGDLLERADAALYAAKRSGKDRVALG